MEEILQYQMIPQSSGLLPTGSGNHRPDGPKGRSCTNNHIGPLRCGWSLIINIYILARNVGTSLNQLELFYEQFVPLSKEVEKTRRTLGVRPLTYMFRSIAVFYCLTIAAAVLANEEQTRRLVIANYLHEVVECASFYSIIGSGESAAQDAEPNLGRFLKLSENLVLTAISLADEIGMDKDVIVVKFAENTSRMGEIISYDAINIALLTDKYGEHCKVVVEDPTSRLIYWMNNEQG